MVQVFDTPITTTDQSIDRVLAAGLPVALVFLDGTAPGARQESMERLARAYAGHLLLAKIHVKDNPASVRRYQVSKPPAIVTLRNGEVISEAGAISGKDLEEHVAFLLGKGPRPSIPLREQESGSAYSQPPSSHPITVTDATFDQVVMRSSRPVLVDFWALWCGPCRMTEPILIKLAGELAGRLKIAKVNVDENPEAVRRYNIRSIPTMILVENGRVVDQWMGALPEPALRSRIAPILKS